MPTEARSPVDAGRTLGGTLVFTFPPDASRDIATYNDAEAIFNGLEAT